VSLNLWVAKPPRAADIIPRDLKILILWIKKIYENYSIILQFIKSIMIYSLISKQGVCFQQNNPVEFKFLQRKCGIERNFYVGEFVMETWTTP
jgi:hypothetical protein